MAHNGKILTGLVAAALIASHTTALADAKPAHAAGNAINWDTCVENEGSRREAKFLCTKVKVPKDHNSPGDGTFDMLVGKRRAESGKSLGTIVFYSKHVGSSRAAEAAEYSSWLPQSVFNDFDIISVNSRGIGSRNTENCFTSKRERDQNRQAIGQFPLTTGQRLDYVTSANEFQKKCREALPKHILEANATVHAQDLEVVRKAIGIDQLNFWSRGGTTHEAMTYIDMYPNNVRAAVIQNYSDPVRLQGSTASSHQSFAERTGAMRSGEKLLDDALAKCDAAGAEECVLASEDPNGPTAKDSYQKVMDTLRNGPVQFQYTTRVIGADGDILSSESSYEEFLHHEVAEQLLYIEDRIDIERAMEDLQFILQGINSDGEVFDDIHVDRQGEEAALQQAKQLLDKHSTRTQELGSTGTESWKWSSPDIAHVNMCNNSHFSPGMTQARSRVHRAEKMSKHFGVQLAWDGMHCHAWPNAQTWQKHSYDAETQNPLLFVAREHSMDVDYDYAKAAAKRFPNSFLLTEKGYEYESDCLDGNIVNYLKTLKMPKVASCEPLVPLFGELEFPDYPDHPGGPDPEYPSFN